MASLANPVVPVKFPSAPTTPSSGNKTTCAIDPTDEGVFVTSNEHGVEETQRILRGSSLRGNATVCTSGLFGLDIASLKDGIEHIVQFDISTRTQFFWEGMNKILCSGLNRVDTIQAIKDFISTNRMELFEDPGMADEYIEGLGSDIENNLSFLSTDARFARIQRVFQQGNFQFRLLDLGNTLAFQEMFADLKQRNIVPHVIYTSNIPTVTTGMCNCDRYLSIARSLRSLPTEAIVIDAGESEEMECPSSSEHRRDTQRVYLGSRPTLVPVPNYFTIVDAIHSGRYHLIAHAVDFDMTDSSGYTPLMSSAERGDYLVVQTLVRSGASPNQAQPDGFSVLHCAAYSDDARTIDILIRAGADIHAVDRSRMTPLHHAAVMGNVEAVKALLAHGADATRIDKKGYTPLRLAMEKGNLTQEQRTAMQSAFSGA